MKRYKNVEVEGTASIEASEVLLAGTAAEPKHVDGLWITESTAVENMDATIRVWLNTLLIVNMPLMHLLTDNATSTRYFRPYIELDLDLASGDQLEVGHLSGGTASDMNYCAQYEVR